MLFQSSRRLEFNSIAFDCELLRNDAISNAKKSFSLSNSFPFFSRFIIRIKEMTFTVAQKRRKKRQKAHSIVWKIEITPT